ncbi:hypothetical protein CC78DRAFT_222639 [Lojkania enalia]|uniref:DUF6590 domain-containing protein n=1 Tax=Lojkania enalia TaxID=147567 RepID=A0A9P4MU95_9PLEO|nr:hypothetical protein CC78DRAFT_222639 [Didymosphaeria enalia]
MDTEWIWDEGRQDYYRWHFGPAGQKTLVWARSTKDPPRKATHIPDPRSRNTPAPTADPRPSATYPYPTPYYAPPPNAPSASHTPVQIHGYASPVHRSSSGDFGSPYQQPFYQFTFNVPAPPSISSSPAPILDPGGSRFGPPSATLVPSSGVNSQFSQDTRHCSHSSYPGPPPSTRPIEPPLDAHVGHNADFPMDDVDSGRLNTPVPVPVPVPALDSRYETIRDGKRYFRKGKVFMTYWTEPKGESTMATVHHDPNVAYQPPAPSSSGFPAQPHSLDNTIATEDPELPALGNLPISEELHTAASSTHGKTRRFVVIRSKSKHCLCLPIHTYSRQATSKPGTNPEDHAPLVREGSEPEFHPHEQQDKLKQSLSIIIEDDGIPWSPLSRINFSKVYTVEYNLRVRKIGRIEPKSVDLLEAHFRESIGLSDT